MSDIKVKTKDNYNGRKTVHYATFGGGKLSDFFDVAHEVAKAANCKLNDIQFEITGRGNWIMASAPGVEKGSKS
jgi:hypothetical protein